MKITFLLTQDIGSPSGLGRYTPWAKELVRLGHDVRIIALHPDYSNLGNKNLTISGINVIYAAQMHVKKNGNTKTYFSPGELIWIALRGTIGLTSKALAKSSDALIIGKPHPMNSIAAFFVKMLKPKTRIILDCDDFESGSNRFQAPWQKGMVNWFENLVPRKAQSVTSNTHFNIDRLERLGIQKQKLIYVPNGIDLDRFGMPKQEEVDLLRSSLDLNDKKVISYIGSMSLINHPVDLLLNSFKLVQNVVPNAVLLLVGGGEDLSYLQNMAKGLDIESSTHFIGRVPPDRIALYYALSDVSVDPVYDNDAARGRCPLKMFESWACGVPFVTGDVGDRRLLMGDPPAGYLVKAGEEDSLAEGLIKIFKDPFLGNKLKQNGLREIDSYLWKKIVDQTQWMFKSKNSIVKE